MSTSLAFGTTGLSSNAFSASAIGGDSNLTTAPLTPRLICAAPGPVFAVSGSGKVAAALDSSSNLYVCPDTTAATPVFTQIVSASTLGTTLNRLALSPDGTIIYATANSNKILSILVASPHTVSVLAGSGAAASTDGTGAGAAFHLPYGLDISPDGTYLITDNNRFNDGSGAAWWFRKVVISTGVVTTVSGNMSALLYQNPGTLRVGRSGTIYFTANGVTIYKAIPAAPNFAVVFTTPGNFVGAWTIDPASPGEVNLYCGDQVYGDDVIVRVPLAAPSTPSINPLATLTAATWENPLLLEMHFRQNFQTGSIYLIDVANNLWQISG